MLEFLTYGNFATNNNITIFDIIFIKIGIRQILK